MAGSETTASGGDAGRSCPYCRFALKQGTAIMVCGDCGAAHHMDCWADNGGCAVMGCAGGPEKPRPPVPVPVPAPTPGAGPQGPPPPPPPAPAPPAGQRSLPLVAVAIVVLALAVTGAAVALVVTNQDPDPAPVASTTETGLDTTPTATTVTVVAQPPPPPPTVTVVTVVPETPPPPPPPPPPAAPPPPPPTDSGDCTPFNTVNSGNAIRAHRINVRNTSCAEATAMIASGPSGRVARGWRCPITGNRNYTYCSKSGGRSVGWHISFR